MPFWSKLFEENDSILPGSEVGKANGLTVLLDAETYDYTYYLRAGEGFKVCMSFTFLFHENGLPWNWMTVNDLKPFNVVNVWCLPILFTFEANT